LDLTVVSDDMVEPGMGRWKFIVCIWIVWVMMWRKIFRNFSVLLPFLKKCETMKNKVSPLGG
jgi:hypothetical protein